MRTRIAYVGIVAALALVGACSNNGSSATVQSGPPTGTSSAAPATSFAAADVPGVGTVVVDGRGRTVYILTANAHSNLPCTDASGCTNAWPDLPLPDGVKSAAAGSGLSASMLSTKKLSDGETYPTYNGWLMYEYSGDTTAGTANGEGIHSFGGTWYALAPSGKPVTSGQGPASSGSSSSPGYGSGY